MVLSNKKSPIPELKDYYENTIKFYKYIENTWKRHFQNGRFNYLDKDRTTTNIEKLHGDMKKKFEPQVKCLDFAASLIRVEADVKLRWIFALSHGIEYVKNDGRTDKKTSQREAIIQAHAE